MVGIPQPHYKLMRHYIYDSDAEIQPLREQSRVCLSHPELRCLSSTVEADITSVRSLVSVFEHLGFLI